MGGGPDSRSLSDEECLIFLASTTRGRLGLTVDDMPAIRAIHYQLVTERVVFRVPVHSDVYRGAVGQIVAFEADDSDPERQLMWTVHGRATCHEVRSPEFAHRLRELLPPLFVDPDVEDRVLRLEFDSLEGEQFSFADPIRVAG
jgi:hypothetical protein